jgi:hypothetical protein
MVCYSIHEYKLQGFQKSSKQFKKYDAILKNKETGRIVKVGFGDNRYENYADKTGLNLYPNLLHGDKERRRLYRLRHEKDLRQGCYSAGYFAYHYLW